MPVLKEMLKRYDLILVTPKLNEWMGYGVVEVACGEVLAFKDSAQVAKDAEHHYIDGGISILKSGLIRRAQSFEGGFQAYIDKIMSEKKVASYIPDAWFDIGTPDAYRHTCASELFRNLFVKSKCISR